MPQAWPGLLLVLRLELGNVADQIVLDALARRRIRAISEVGDGLGEALIASSMSMTSVSPVAVPYSA